MRTFKEPNYSQRILSDVKANKNKSLLGHRGEILAEYPTRQSWDNKRPRRSSTTAAAGWNLKPNARQKPSVEFICMQSRLLLLLFFKTYVVQQRIFCLAFDVSISEKAVDLNAVLMHGGLELLFPKGEKIWRVAAVTVGAESSKSAVRHKWRLPTPSISICIPIY